MKHWEKELVLFSNFTVLTFFATDKILNNLSRLLTFTNTFAVFVNELTLCIFFKTDSFLRTFECHPVWISKTGTHKDKNVDALISFASDTRWQTSVTANSPAFFPRQYTASFDSRDEVISYSLVDINFCFFSHGINLRCCLFYYSIRSGTDCPAPDHVYFTFLNGPIFHGTQLKQSYNPQLHSSHNRTGHRC